MKSRNRTRALAIEELTSGLRPTQDDRNRRVTGQTPSTSPASPVRRAPTKWLRFAAALAATLAAVISAAAAGRELTGRVVDANTGEPIARAHIGIRFLQAGQPAPEVTLLSEADGTFKVTNMPDGQVQVTCEKAGYLPVNQMMAPMPPAAQGTDNRGAATVMKMTAQAAIQGTVLDDRDMPADAMVQLMSQPVVNGRRQWLSAQSTGTDETGSFRLFALPAGRYYISISARLHGALATKPLAYPPFYYPNATDIAAAQPLDLKAGDEAEIKIKLPAPVPAYTVSGSISTGATNIGLNMSRQTSTHGYQPTSGDLRLDQQTKTFRFTHVTPGVYLVTANVFQNGGSSMSATATVSVGNADVTGVSLDPADIGVDGTVRVDDSTRQQIGGFVSLQSDRLTNGFPVGADGKFHIPNLQPGDYRIVPQISGSQTCVLSILSSGRDVRDGLTIAAGAPPDPIDILVSTHCGSVDVTLSPSDATLPPNLTAYLLRKSGDELVLERTGFQGPRSSDGAHHFQITGVAPGDYVVYVWPSDAPIEYTNAEYMRQFDSLGQKITVSADSQTPVTVDRPVLLPSKN